MSIALPNQLTTSPLTAEHHRALSEAQRHAEKIRAVARMAAFNGWMTAAFALLSVPFIGTSAVATVVTLALMGVAASEFYGRKLVLKLDPNGPAWLGWNQVAFMAFIVLYCLWMIAAEMATPTPFAQQLGHSPELRLLLGDITQWNELYRTLILVVYGSVIFFTILMQGANALYYFSRQHHLREYVANTPVWIVELQSQRGLL